MDKAAITSGLTKPELVLQELEDKILDDIYRDIDRINEKI